MDADPTTSPGDLPAAIEAAPRHEAMAIVAAALTLLGGLGLLSYDAASAENWIGPVGLGIASTLAAAFGLGAWVIPAELGLATVRLGLGRRSLLGVATVAATLVVLLVGCALLHLLLAPALVFGGHLPGGVLGEVLGEVLRSLFGTAGAYVVTIAVLLVTVVLRTPFSITDVIAKVALTLRALLGRARASVNDVVRAWREARELEAVERERAEAALAPKIVGSAGETVAESGPRATADAEAAPDDDDALDVASIDDVAELDDDAAPTDAADDEGAEDASAAAATSLVLDAPIGPSAPAAKAKRKPKGPTIVAPSAEPPGDAAGATAVEKAKPAAKDKRPARGLGQAVAYLHPPTAILRAAPPSQIKIDAQKLRDNATRLVEKLNAYGVRGRVDEIHPGPVVTMYEFEPESGTKLSKIASLADDLALALAAQKVRIVAPIPGKARVGFELPNEHRDTVSLRELLEDQRWTSLDAALPVALGKDIAGKPVYGDLAKMPHLLVAGATGAGKSVGLNVMLTSLLMKKAPEDVRLLMIDPKVVELAVFDGIPHMLLPVVTDMKKASLALKWAVDEMERRYQLFADAGSRNIESYNDKVRKVLAGELAHEKLMPSRVGKVTAQGPDGAQVLLDPVDGESATPIPDPTRLPYIVVVVDEFADLMMVAAKDVEAWVARLAQKARAAGIHVILATQRPSVDVITGMIKANFPARIAFKVSQREDSKTILGRIGAEHLLGRGDMLMIPPGSSDLRRVHSAFVSEDEVTDVCEHLRAQGKPIYDDEILKPRDEEGEEGGGDAGAGPASDDPLYDKAVAAVAAAGYCSISHLQRQLGAGYNKAAKLVERMEKEGIVGPASAKAGGRREVLIGVR